jgi:hypothetical protein
VRLSPTSNVRAVGHPVVSIAIVGAITLVGTPVVLCFNTGTAPPEQSPEV